MSEPASIKAGLAKIVSDQHPSLSLAGHWEYTVDAVTDEGRCDLTALEKGPPPTLKGADQWPGIGGSVAKPTVGSVALVVFRSNMHSRPAIVGFQPLRQTGGTPTLTKVDANTVQVGPTATLVTLAADPGDASPEGVGRVNDAVAIGYLTGTTAAGPVTFVLSATPPTLAPGDPAGFVANLTGKIIEGSTKVRAG